MMVPDSPFPTPKSETPVERFDLFPILRIARGLCLHCICHFSGRFFYLVGHGLMSEATPIPCIIELLLIWCTAANIIYTAIWPL